MRAAYIEETGPPDVIKIGELPSHSRARAGTRQGCRGRAQPDRPLPSIGPHPDAAGLSLRDRLRRGRHRREARPGRTRFKVGDRVWGSNQGLLGRQGVAAEFAAVDEDWLYPTPEKLTDNEAAAMALVGITAHLGLFRFGQLKEGESIYVPGGIRRRRIDGRSDGQGPGRKVATSAGSPERVELCRNLGPTWL